MSSSQTTRGPVAHVMYAIGFLIGAIYSLLLWPFYSPKRRMKKFIAQDRRYNG